MTAIDLHAHSNASDGTDTPGDLVALAQAAGLDVVAITDHDTTAGWAAAEASRPDGLTLIRGAEFSTMIPVRGPSVSVHLLGYLFDPADPTIVTEQARLVAERLDRGRRMVDKMIDDDVPITHQQVLDIAAGAPIGRPHIGRALVDAKLVRTVTEAFDELLAGHSRYYVPKRDTELGSAIDMIVNAGGAPVIAHPRGRGERRGLTAELIGELADRGLAGLEINHPDHDAAERAELAEIARRHGLIVTGSSDYHGHNKTLKLGQERTEPSALQQLIDKTSGVTPPLGWQ